MPTQTPQTVVIGIDLSLTATGLSTPDQTATITTTPKDGDTIARARIIADHIDAAIERHQPVDLIVIEGTFSAGRGRDVEIGKLHGAIQWALTDDTHYCHRCDDDGFPPPPPLHYVAPTKLKKFATGTGNANKVAMIVAARERLNLDTLDDNEADAAWLREYGHHLLGQPTIDLPAKHLTAVETL